MNIEFLKSKLQTRIEVRDLCKGKKRPLGYVSPGGFVKTAKGWRKVAEGRPSGKKEMTAKPVSVNKKVFERKVRKLQEIEEKARQTFYNIPEGKEEERLMNPNSRVNRIRDHWEDLIEDIQKNYPKEWEKLGKREGITMDYTFADVLA